MRSECEAYKLLKRADGPRAISLRKGRAAIPKPSTPSESHCLRARVGPRSGPPCFRLPPTIVGAISFARSLQSAAGTSGSYSVMKEISRKQRVLAWVAQTAPDENDGEMSLAEIVPIYAPDGYALFKNLGETPNVAVIPASGFIWAVYAIQGDGDVHPTPIGYSEVAPSELHEPDWEEKATDFLAEMTEIGGLTSDDLGARPSS